MFWSLVLVGFLLVNIYAFAAGDFTDLVRYLRELGPWGRLATVDLCLSLGIGVAWMWGDARQKGISPVPYAILTLLTGSVGLLLYLARHGGSPDLVAERSFGRRA
jgi:hypothetical protein